ncbi:MAG: hypothetical protein JSW61_05760 [Candidatus Thorarchaeota archaeon]|nr:MAG: hypothetical protein JSW61_05760 [Candidatus Thorarchaeota archaeon]
MNVKREVSIGRKIFGYAYPPIGWGAGAALLAWIGFAQTDLITAFVVGFLVGVFHDLALIKIYDYRDNLHVYAQLEGIYNQAMNHYESDQWIEALEKLNEILLQAPDHKRALRYAIECNQQLSRLDDVQELRLQYDEYYPGVEESD